MPKKCIPSFKHTPCHLLRSFHYIINHFVCNDLMIGNLSLISIESSSRSESIAWLILLCVYLDKKKKKKSFCISIWTSLNIKGLKKKYVKFAGTVCSINKLYRHKVPIQYYHECRSNHLLVS